MGVWAGAGAGGGGDARESEFVMRKERICQLPLLWARPLVSSSGLTASVRVRKHGGRDGQPFAPSTPEATPKRLQLGSGFSVTYSHVKQ
jgi:hypothetical protein